MFLPVLIKLKIMKKLTFLFAMVFVAGFAMAQNTATVAETGNLNKSNVDQTGSLNSAVITQIGDNNDAATADKYASSLFGVLTGTKGIIQNGSGNSGTIYQENQLQGFVSAGPIAGMGQYGNNNSASISQKGKSAWMQEYAWAKQTGDGNTSIQIQNGYQYSHILQISGEQSGQQLVGNFGKTEQLQGYNLKANILQIGKRNHAYQLQTKLSAWNYDNLAEATQTGNDNTSNQYQYGSSNTAKTIQQSNWNTTNLTQSGDNNFTSVLQKTGDYNVVNLSQTRGADANILQDGDHNTLMGLNADPMATSLDGSTLDLDQIGSSNTLHLQQTKGAAATVYQNGMNNTSIVIQN